VTLARCHGVALVGVRGHVVEVEADLADGIPCFSLVGLPDTALSEARDRVRAAIVNSGRSWPHRRITIGLSPATLPKAGSGFDLALAVTLVAAAEQWPADVLAGTVLFGELGLDGRVRAVRGVLPAALAAAQAGFARIVVPRANLAEAELVPGVQPCPVSTLRELLARLRGDPLPDEEVAEAPEPTAAVAPGDDPPDLCDVVGQPDARFALEVAAAGGHNLFMIGPPGAGKTMLAVRLPGILPPLEPAEAIEVTTVHSVAGRLPEGFPLVTSPPYCAPHHTASVASLVGGGSSLIRPGLVSLAHRGVLFLDEAPEFHRVALDALRQPLESGEVTVARASGTVRFPARFLLVLAANPCPCAAGGAEAAACSCGSVQRRRYLARLSGPLLDRVDVRIRLLPVGRAAMLADREATEDSATVAKRVTGARDAARERWRPRRWRTNAEVPGSALRGRWRLPAGSVGSAMRALERGELTARGFDRVLRMAWTIADLAGRPVPDAGDVDEAITLRRSA
jgi:magnesium chelatase family protein